MNKSIVKIVVEVIANVVNILLFGYLKKRKDQELSPLEEQEESIQEEEISLKDHIPYLSKNALPFGLLVELGKDQDNNELYEIKESGGKALGFYRTPIEVMAYIDGYEDGKKKP